MFQVMFAAVADVDALLLVIHDGLLLFERGSDAGFLFEVAFSLLLGVLILGGIDSGSVFGRGREHGIIVPQGAVLFGNKKSTRR